MELYKPRKDRYNPDNCYRICINLSKHPGVKWVSFKNKETGEVTKGIFIPDYETGGIRVRERGVILEAHAIPVKGLVNTHVIIPSVNKGVNCGLGYKSSDFRKATIGNMYVSGEILSEDYRRMIQKYAERHGKRIAAYKKD